MTTTLERRTLFGHSLPPIAIGCAPIGDMPDTFAYSVPEDLAHATVRAALESELNWLDTAASYGHGESERRIGRVLREMGGLPEGAFLNTKIGATEDGRYDADSTREQFARSQELLGIETFDLVFLHDPEQRPWEEITGPGGPVEALFALRDEGKIRHVGIAGGPIDLLINAIETQPFEAVITHNRYTLLNRAAEPLIEKCHRRGIPLFNAAPYGSGLLAKAPDQYPRYAYGEASEIQVGRARELEAVCARHEVPLAAAALQFSLRERRIDGTIVGMTRPERIEQTLEFATVTIPDDCWNELLSVPFDTDDL
jgi:D-threo-aldose 1-dehydrogenase